MYFLFILNIICIKISDDIGLDKFLNSNTSEDNQSFNEIIKEAEIQFQKKVFFYLLILNCLKLILKQHFKVKIVNFSFRMHGYSMVKKKH